MDMIAAAFAPKPATPPVAMPRPADAMLLQDGKYPVREVIVHCAATRPDALSTLPVEAKMGEIRKWHQARGWKREGYHWLIDRDGSVTPGRPETERGAHVAGRNNGTIGICLWGGHGSAATDHFRDNFTPAQDRALRKLIADIQRRTQINRISGHNEYAAKACPGFNVDKWIRGAE
jgi:N-acetyl-anhydromuramyl-L-alanine amidase AmpD